MKPSETNILKKTARLYITKTTVFKLFLLFGVAAISTVFVWYTFDLIEELKEDNRSRVDKYVKMWQMAANSPTSGEELQFIFDEIIVKANFPIIVLDQDRQPIHWRNIENISVNDTTVKTKRYLKEIAEQMIADHDEFPLYFGNLVNYFCYGDSKIINELKMMPFIEIAILIAFLLLAFIGFQNIKESEERNIWVGMSKETAHQLGTPISSILGWLEVIKADQDQSYVSGQPLKVEEETLDNILIDTHRLEKIATRFGLIGSVPELKLCDVNKLIGETVEYYRRRLPFEGEGIKINFEPGNVSEIKINFELFGWVLENIIKNALQVIDSKTGVIDIKTKMVESKNSVKIEITDNGTGISAAAGRKIFRAGFTTKKRGWGLGLTLVKRIIEEYHNGKISLKKSKPGETVFEILLPVS